MLLMCARPLLFEGINVGHVSQSVPPCHRQTRLLMGTYPHYAALWTSVFAGHGPSSSSHGYIAEAYSQP
jgi:hypothetical protein